MNIDKLKASENEFFNIFPLGFQDEEMIKIEKKHKVDSRILFTPWIKVKKT